MLALALVSVGQGTAPQDTTRPQDRTAQPAAGATTGRLAETPHVDGTWTILAVEYGGKSLDKGDMQTVTIRNNVLSFGKAGEADRGTSESRTEKSGNEKSGSGTADRGDRSTTGGQAGGAWMMHRKWRLYFGPANILAASPEGGQTGGDRTGTSGSDNTGKGTGTDRTGTGGTGGQGTTSGTGDTGRRTGTGALRHTHTGVYIAATGYLCLSLGNAAEGYYGSPGRTSGTGTDRGQSGTGGTGTDRGQSGTGGTGATGTDRTGGQTGTTGGTTGSSRSRQSFVLILRRQRSGESRTGSGTSR
jgi:hypothetical protein